MQKILFTALISFFSICVFSQEKKDYTHYHKEINKAEVFFLKENNVDSCLYYYDKTFEAFDFIFVKDAMNAAQIAYFSKKDYKKYLIKGFDYGLKLDHLRWIKLFEPDLKKLLVDKDLLKEHASRKKNYLEKLDLEYLNTIYIFGIQDQLDKQTTNWRLYDEKKKK